MISTLRSGLLVIFVALPLMASAAGSAHDLVQDTTNDILAALSTNKEQYKKYPTKLYDALNTIVGPAVDTEGISRSIMTVRYSRKATTSQMQRFRKNIKIAMFQLYGTALLEYNGHGITIGPAKEELGDRTSIGIAVRGNNGTIYPVQYTMDRINGEWKLRNVIINGINIGKMLRDQFSESMQRNGNNLDETISIWGGEVDKTKEEPDKYTGDNNQ